ncbi:MAG: hypothetical protein JXR70_17275 [Spirochaetales bacterium]|nr:hypothetical protein [Spirochaetales bacterium]
MKLIIPILAICLVLSLSCASQIPNLSESNGKGLLLVKSDVSTQNSSGMFISLNFFYSKNEYFSVTPNSKIWISDQLRPGKYTISRLGVYNKSSSNYSGFYDLNNLNIEVKEGHITLFPAKITTSMNSGGYLSFGLVNLEDDDVQSVIDYLQARKSADGWVLQMGNSEGIVIKVK